MRTEDRPPNGVLHVADRHGIGSAPAVPPLSPPAPRIFAMGHHSPVPVLTVMHEVYILICMRTTINIDDSLLEKARRLTGIDEKTALVRQGLEALIALESARRLARLGGTEPEFETPRRRRPAP